MRALVWASFVMIPDCEPVKPSAGTPRALSASESSAIEMRSPADSSMSSSRREGLSLTRRASASSSSVVSPIADTTTTTPWPAARVAATRSATRRMRSTSATDEPPNFCTTTLMGLTILVSPAAAARGSGGTLCYARAVAGDGGEKLGTWQSVRAVAGSWRLLSVALLSFSSGLPLGLVWIAIPAWLTRAGVDIKVVGLFTLAQAPWSFKFLWSPLMDRYAPPLLGRKRGWMLLAQAGLCALGLWLAGVSDHPEAVWVVGSLTLAIALVAATQDIAYDAYAVEVLRREEHGLAVGARVAFYRAAMYLSSGLAITYAARTSWALVNLVLALAYVPFMLVTIWAPE